MTLACRGCNLGCAANEMPDALDEIFCVKCIRALTRADERLRIENIVSHLRTELAHCSVRWAFDRLVEKINETTAS